MNNGHDPRYGYNPNQYQQPYSHQYPQHYQHPGQQQQQVVVIQEKKRPFDHTKHLLVSIFTCGAWVPFWIILWIVD